MADTPGDIKTPWTDLIAEAVALGNSLNQEERNVTIDWCRLQEGYRQAKAEDKDLRGALEAIKRNLVGAEPGTKAFAALIHAKVALNDIPSWAKGGG